MDTYKNRKRRASELLGAKVCQDAGAHEESDVGGHRGEFAKSRGDRSDTEALQAWILETDRTHETVLATTGLRERPIRRLRPARPGLCGSFLERRQEFGDKRQLVRRIVPGAWSAQTKSSIYRSTRYPRCQKPVIMLLLFIR